MINDDKNRLYGCRQNLPPSLVRGITSFSMFVNLKA